MGNRHEKLPLYAVVLSKRYLRGDATLCCPFQKKRISLGSKSQKTKKKKIIKKKKENGAERKHLLLLSEWLREGLSTSWNKNFRISPNCKTRLQEKH